MYGPGNFGWSHMGYGSWGMGFGGIGMILFWVLIIVGVVALARLFVASPRAERRREKTALDVLNESYARGEIKRDEYEQKKRDIAN